MRVKNAPKQLAQRFQAAGRNYDGIAPPSDFFGDAQKTAARVFAQIERKHLAFDGQLLEENLSVHDPAPLSSRRRSFPAAFGLIASSIPQSGRGCQRRGADESSAGSKAAKHG